jgi:hypothetical protein
MHTSTATTKGATPMTTRTRDTRTALDAYLENRRAALVLVERIRTAIDNHDSSPDPDRLNWGHVGDIARARSQLQEISDQLFHEGEHAD